MKKQQTPTKLKNMLDIYTKIILYVLGIGLFSYQIILNYFNLGLLDFGTLISIISACSFLIGFLWKIFNNYLWKNIRINNKLPSIYATPIIAGRWEGEFIRDAVSHEFVIEIYQDYTNLEVRTFSKHSKSISITADLIYDKITSNYQLVYWWECNTENNTLGKGAKAFFNGYTILDLIIVPTEKNKLRVKSLEGHYFTDRKPKQTFGRIYMDKSEEKVKNLFAL